MIRSTCLFAKGYWSRLGICFVVTLHALVCHAQNFVPFTSSWKPFEGAADFSYLNSPLQPEDRLVVSGAKFVRVGKDLKGGTADDVPVRLFGMNLSHHAAFPDEAQAKLTAKTLRSLGFNAVRLHHLDTLPSGNPQEYRATLTDAPFPTLHTGAIERLRNFLGVLKQEGIYANLNITVGYTFRPKEDGIPPINGADGPAFNSPAVVFHPRLIELQQQYATQLIKALGVGNDPVLAQIEIINENSLSSAWFNWNPSFWQNQIAGPYADELQRQWRQWLIARHGSLENACKQWGALCPTPVDKLPTPNEIADTSGRISQESASFAQQALLKVKKIFLNSKNSSSVDIFSDRRVDFFTFMADTDRAFLDKMKASIMKVARSDLPIGGGQANVLGPLNMLSQDRMSWVDVHHYTDHPDYPGGVWSQDNWRIKNSSIANGDFIEIGKLTDYRDLHRPFVVSEYNQPYPNTNGSEIIPILSAYAATQDWNGLYFFDYIDYKFDRNSPNYFNFQGDWQKAVMTGHAAKIFRGGLLPNLNATRIPPVTKESLLRAASQSRQFNVWSQYLEKQQGYRSDDEFMRYKWGHDLLGINSSPAAQSAAEASTGAIGKLGANAIFLNGASVVGFFGQLPKGSSTKVGPLSLTDDSSPSQENIALVLHALDGVPLDKSKHLLLSVPGVLFGSTKGSFPPRMQQLARYQGQGDWWTLSPSKQEIGSGVRETVAPVWIGRRPLRLKLTNTALNALRVFPLTPNGSRGNALPEQFVTKTADGWEIRVNYNSSDTALWFELTNKP